ncbi:hypothetical protein BGZ60DRAFT_432298 [Tricladium varicosporioides]|nr:hypothetical protein BGZ60DRAFT_432298 [Hymenoscyphus varicosporioides]
MSSRVELPNLYHKSESEPNFLLSHSEDSGGVRINPITKTTYEILALLRNTDTPIPPAFVGPVSAVSPDIVEKRRLFREAVAAARIRHQSAFGPCSARKEEMRNVEVGEFGDWKTEHTPSFINTGTSSSWAAPASSRSNWIEFSAPNSSPSDRTL